MANTSRLLIPRILAFGSGGQQFAHHQAGNRKHQAQFNTNTDEQQESSSGWDGPKGMPGEMLDQGVADFV